MPERQCELVAFGATYGQHPRMAVVLSVFGVVCALTWAFANRGSKYWHEAWEEKVHREERRLIGPLFSLPEIRQDKGWWLSARRYSVSRMAIALADYVLILWLMLVSWQTSKVVDWRSFPRSIEDLALLGFEVASLCFVAFMLWKGRSGPVATTTDV
jgi:hypothetical protein